MIALVPTKGEGAKSRLDVPPQVRALLVSAMREDVLAALAASAHLARAETVDAPTGLVPALRERAATLAVSDPDTPVVVVPADLAALTPVALDAVLGAARAALGPGRELAFVRDADGTGTTLLIARSPHRLDPRYGPGSAERHAEIARELPADDRVRRDVDTVADLDAAIALGLGPATSAALSPAGSPRTR